MRRTSLAETLCLRIEGGFLAPSIVRRLLNREMPRSNAASYHLEGGYTIGEGVTRSWNRMLAAWKAFSAERDRLPGEPGAKSTRERLLLPLFEELGYGRLPFEGSLQADGERFAISHRWSHVPIHLVGADTELDRRSEGVAGAARRSPHGLVLEYLNRSPEGVWGFVANGLRVRLLRENRSIARQPYLEFDLEAVLEGQSFSDFTALWLLCHESRLEGKPEESILESWRNEGIAEGERALEDLRDGVERAVNAIGSGLLAHPANTRLREALRKGEASSGATTEDLYHQLLRIVYRLIFLFVAEDRDLLLAPGTRAEVRKRYLENYSTRRLRTLARTIRGGGHADLWRCLLTVMRLLHQNGCPALGLSALGSFLWDPASVSQVADGELANRALLAAVRALAFTERGGSLWPTDFRNLGSEELGSVYESLLELHPEANLEAGSFRLVSAAGNERKISGSFYTPSSLVERLLDEALDPLIEEAARSRDPERALLGLRVCDPAMGSGHFLTAAAQRIGKRLAQVRSGDPEPSPESLRHALRSVVSQCLHGVDLNPLAVELCKVSLWMEGLEPGRPLSFLDHHLKCGNSLVGATRAHMAKGIPEGAFTPLTLDDPSVCRQAKKRNSEELDGNQSLFEDAGDIFPDYAAVARRISELDVLEESTLEGVALLADRYRSILESDEYRLELAAANAWCAAFFLLKTSGIPEPLTQETYVRFMKSPGSVPKPTARAVEAVAAEAHFFHWELAFPEVFRPSDGSPGGFDVVLGNPPWERIKLQETEWFAEREPDIAGARNAAERKKKIEALRKEDAPLHREYQLALRSAECISSFLRRSGRYPLCGKGDVNLYSVFTELGRSLLSPRGRLGIVVPSGIATDDTTKEFFGDLVEKRSLVSLYDFENHGLFPGVHSSYKFCLLTVAGQDRGGKALSRFVFFAHRVADLKDEARLVELEPADFALMNPNTRTCPIFRSRRDAELTRSIYRRVPVLIKEGDPQGNPWGIKFLAMLHMANDSGLFRTREQLEAKGFQLQGARFVKGGEMYLPLYEAKMLHHFDHRWGTYDGTEVRDVTGAEKADPTFAALPRYWVPALEVEDRLEGRWDRQWLLGWRDICRSTDERTVIASVLPHVGVGHKFPLILADAAPPSRACLVANLNCFAHDYVARQKLGGTSLTYFVLKQLPILPSATYAQTCPWEASLSLRDWMLPRVLELVYTAHDLEPFARDCGYSGSPFPWNPERRFQLRCELDAAYFHLYGIARGDVDYIMETFPIVKRHDEQKHGNYRTKDAVLEYYDAYANSSSPTGREKTEVENI